MEKLNSLEIIFSRSMSNNGKKIVDEEVWFPPGGYPHPKLILNPVIKKAPMLSVHLEFSSAYNSFL